MTVWWYSLAVAFQREKSQLPGGGLGNIYARDHVSGGAFLASPPHRCIAVSLCAPHMYRDEASPDDRRGPR